MPTPPDSLPDDASALKALLVAAPAENERLIAIIKELQRYRFGPRSEKIDPGQLALMLEDVEQAIAASAAQAESQTEDQPAKTPVQRKRQVNRGALPKHLPREDVVVDIADKSCPCCNGLRVKIGEDVSERLDIVAARFKRDGPHCALDDVVVDFDPPVVEISGQARPARERVADRLGDGRFAGDCGELGIQPRLHRVEDRFGPGLADGLPRRRAEGPEIAL